MRLWRLAASPQHFTSEDDVESMCRQEGIITLIDEQHLYGRCAEVERNSTLLPGR